MEINNEVLVDAMKSALRVEFLSSSEELKLYANALYSAVMWGRGIDGKNRVIRERDKSLK